MELKKGTLYFFTGLSGAGKTTIGGAFYRRLKARKNDVLLLDGDATRTAREEKDYSTEARLNGARNMCKTVKSLTEEGHDVVYCTISMYQEIRDWYRENLQHFHVVYVKVSMDTLYRRDQKGLYSSGAKQVVGVDLPWDEPVHPDVVIENDGNEDPEKIVDRLFELFGLNDDVSG